MSQQKKLILVIGATGVQGIAVIDALLTPAADGSSSPYTVRALTRDPKSRRAQLLAEKGVELFAGTLAASHLQFVLIASRFSGSFDDLRSVTNALEGAYGAWVNTDGFTVGEAKEIYAGIRIFELSKQTKSMRHYIWSNLENIFRVSLVQTSGFIDF